MKNIIVICLLIILHDQIRLVHCVELLENTSNGTTATETSITTEEPESKTTVPETIASKPADVDRRVDEINNDTTIMKITTSPDPPTTTPHATTENMQALLIPPASVEPNIRNLEVNAKSVDG